MDLNTIDIYCFSGTGNSLLAVKKMREVFLENGIEVNIYPIEKANPQTVNLENMLGLAFPVACFSTYPLVWDFVKALPPASKTKIFMLATMGGFAGGVVYPLKRVLQKKGYQVSGAMEIQMPSNFMIKKVNKTEDQKTIEKGLIKARHYAIELMNGRAYWGGWPGWSQLIHLVMNRKNQWRDFRKLCPLVIDKTKCNRCGICIKICPVNNIEMKEYPEYLQKCQVCMRCVAFCPTQAITMCGKWSSNTAVSAEDIISQGVR